MALQLRRLSSLLLIAAAIGCPKPVGVPQATITPLASGAFPVGQVIRLDGTSSADPQGRDLTFTWSFTQLPVGSAAVLNDAHSQSPSFTADVDGTYGVQLVVANAFLTSTAATQTITVSKCGGRAPENSAPSAVDAQSAGAPGVGSTVLLSATVRDPDAHTEDGICTSAQVTPEVITYSWRLIAQPASSSATLNNPSAKSPSFVADVDGNYTVRLVTSDQTGRSSAPLDFTFTVSTCGANAPQVSTVTPTPAHPEYGASIGNSVQFTPIVTDVDNNAAICPGRTPQTFTYEWSMPELPVGSHAALNSTTAIDPTFTPDVAGNYTIRLVATDSSGRKSAPKDTQINITACGGNAPAATITGPGSVNIGDVVQLDQTVSDADNTSTCNNIPQTFSYHWALRSVPAGSNAQLNNPTGTSPSFIPDVGGVGVTYRVELIVTDQSGLASAPASWTVAVDSTGHNCGANAPVIDALNPTPTTVNAGTLVTVASSVHDPDNDPPGVRTGCAVNPSQTVSYNWTLTSRPKSSNAVIVNPAAQSAVFTADVVGSYQAQLVITDSTGRASAPVFANISTTSCGTATPTVSAACSFGATQCGPTVHPDPGTQMTLAANGQDTDNACGISQTLTYAWSVVARPASSNATISNPAAQNPTFTPDAIGTYQFQVTVTDQDGHVSDPAYVSFSTSVCGSNAPAFVANSPSASATTIDPGTLVTLNASATDADNGCLAQQQTISYLWTVVGKPAGSSAVLSDPTSPSPTIKPDVAGNFQLQVVATDSSGLSSAPSYLTISVRTCGTIRPTVGAPVISGGTTFSPVTLTPGTISDTNCTLSTQNHLYSWSLVAKPAGSAAILSNPGAQSPQFTPDKAGTYQVSLVVTSAAGLSSDPVYASVDVVNCGTARLQWGGTPVSMTFSDPAGSGVTQLHTGAHVTLSAAATDPNTACGNNVNPYSYQWALVSVPAGSRAELTSSIDATPTFVPDVPGAYQVSVVTTDALGNTSLTPAFLTVTTSSCGANAPTVTTNPSTAQTVTSYATTALTASATTADNTSCPARFNVPSFSYAWSISTKPPQGDAVLSSTSGASTTFEAFSGGAYEVSVVATGSNGLVSAPAKVPFTVSTCGGNAPVVTNVATQVGGAPVSRPAVQTAVDLIASATDVDNDPAGCNLGQTLTYSWSIVQLPSGSAVAAPAPSTNNKFTFTPDVAGQYVFSVVATDPKGLSSAPVQVTVITAACAPSFAGIASSGSQIIGSNIGLSLSGAVSDQCITNPSFFYQWSLVQKPAASQTVLGSTTASTSGFTPDVAGTYQVQLVVTDNAGLSSAPATLPLTISSCGSAAPVLNNATGFSTPIAVSPATPNAGDLVSLSVPNITDPNSSCSTAQLTPYSYRWSLVSVPAGSHASLTSTTSATPSFVADVPNGSYQLAITVTDALGNVSQTKFATVTTTKCGANVPVTLLTPSSSSATPALVNSNTGLALTASATDVDNTAACPASFNVTIPTVSWSIVSAPAGAHAQLTANSTATTSVAQTYSASTVFQASTPGPYVVQAVATAANGIASAPVLEYISVSGCGSNTPTITQVGSFTTDASHNPTSTTVSRPSVGQEVALVATSFDADVSGTACGASPEAAPANAYTWSLVSAPAGSSFTAPSGASSNTLVFTPNVAGTYVFSVTATDIHGMVSAPVSVTIATGTCGPPVTSITATATGSSNVGDTVNASVVLGTDTCVANAGTPTVLWSIVNRPAASSAALTGSTTTTPSFVADAAGGYTLQVVATDVGGFSTVKTVSVNIGACTSAPSITGGMSMISTDPEVSPNTNNTIWRDDRVQLILPGSSITAGSCAAATSSTYTYEWSIVSKPSGSQSALSSSTDAKPVFVADSPNGSYTVMVIVKDQNGNTSQPSFATVPKVSDCGVRAPVVTAYGATTLTPNANAPTTLTAAAVTDPALASPACPARFQNASNAYAYEWSVTSQPAGAQASLSSPTGASTAFQANTAGAYTVQLKVTNWDGNSATNTQTINVNACGANAPAATAFTATQSIAAPGDLSPAVTFASGMWSAGTPLDTGFPVQLAVTASDLDNQPACGSLNQGLSYAWSLVSVPAGSTAALLNGNTATPTLTPDVQGTYVAQLRLTDSLGYSSVSTLQFQTSACGTNVPVINGMSANPAAPSVGQAVALSATVTDNDTACTPSISSANATYQWHFTQLPAGSAAQLFGADTKTPSFIPDVSSATPYKIALVVTDAQGHSSVAQEIAVTAACGGAAPVLGLTTVGGLNTQAVPSATFQQSIANVLTSGSTRSTLLVTQSTDLNAAANGSFYLGYPVQVSVNASDPDNACGASQTLSYQWSITAQPAGSLAALNNPNAVTPSFTPDVPGSYSLRVQVTDSTGRSVTKDLNVAGNGAAFAAAVGQCGSNTPVASVAVTAPYTAAAPVTTVNEPAGSTVLFDASSSSSADITARNLGGCGLPKSLSYSWTLVSRPSGSGASLTGATLTNPSLNLDASGTYQVQVTAQDGSHSGSATVTVNTAASSAVAAVTGNAAFTATTMDASGNTVVVWLDMGAASSPLKFTRCTNCGSASPSWATPIVVDDLGPTPYTWAANTDPRPIDVKVIGTTTYILYATTNASLNAPACSLEIVSIPNAGGPTFSTPVNMGSTACTPAGAGPYTGRWVSLAVRNGLPIFMAQQMDSSTSFANLMYGECNNAACTSFNLGGNVGSADPFMGRWVSLAVDASNNVSAAFAAGSSTQLGYEACTASPCINGGNWAVAFLTSSGDQGRFARLALNSSGQPRIAFWNNGSGAFFGLGLMTCNGSCNSVSSWAGQTVDNVVQTSLDGIGFAIDGNDRYSIVTRNSANSTLRFSTSQGGSAFTTTTLSSATGLPSVAATPTGGVAITAGNGATVQSIVFGK